MSLDLQGPLEDFRKRTQQLRLAMIAIESAAAPAVALTTTRPDIDLSAIGLETRNTTNAMSVVLLASSFEEFVREEVGQCADLLINKYGALTIDIQHKIRGEYWRILLERLNMSNNILTRTKPKSPDTALLAKAKVLLDSGRGFVIDGDSSHLDRDNFFHSKSNFRPHIVNKIISRLGIDDIVSSAADNSKIKSHFGVTKKVDSSERLVAKLDEFYNLRNSIVHSLSGVSGIGVDSVLEYISLMEMTAESITSVLSRQTSKW